MEYDAAKRLLLQVMTMRERLVCLKMGAMEHDRHELLFHRIANIDLEMEKLACEVMGEQAPNNARTPAPMAQSADMLRVWPQVNTLSQSATTNSSTSTTTNT